MQLEVDCPICVKKPETSLHALWRCSSLKELRCVCNFAAGDASLDNVPFIEFVISCSSQLVLKEFELLCIIWWRVWHRRNKAVHNNNILPAAEIYDWGCNFITDYRGANERQYVQKVEVLRPPRWLAPPFGSVKINTDAALNFQLKVAGFGNKPPIAEALAILEGLRFAFSRNFSKVCLESDALCVVQAINNKSPPSSEVGVVLNDIFLVLDRFSEVSFAFVPRLGNKVAHGLAKLELNHEGESVWLNDCPLCVENLVLGDVPISL
ncbi:hypothetical protein EZV62_000112 [Acer yangbiense]|uniref:RNase H type-1 domain-containing protein n=1 Tax=Acer yangbiense TaxID=1000413 RepID=A0A5C7IQ65_9ROSI|nr:hypothetical protein EZV62_000112 [Acer yangbiense]